MTFILINKFNINISHDVKPNNVYGCVCYGFETLRDITVLLGC